MMICFKFCKSREATNEIALFIQFFARVRVPPTNGLEHLGVRAHSGCEHLSIPLSGRVANAPTAIGSRRRFVLYNPLSLCGMSRHQHVADECRAHVPCRVHVRDPEGTEITTLHFGWKRGPCTNSSAGCTMIFSRRFKMKDFHCIVPAPAIIEGRGEMVRLRSVRVNWTVQVGYPPPLTESGARRRAQEKPTYKDDTGISSKENIAETEQRSTPTLGLDLNSDLELKGASEQVEEPFVG